MSDSRGNAGPPDYFFLRCFLAFLRFSLSLAASAAVRPEPLPEGARHSGHSGHARPGIAAHPRPCPGIPGMRPPWGMDGILPPCHLLHHLLHLLEILEQLIDLGDRGPAALGNALLAAGIDDLGVMPLGHGHGVDHGLDLGQLLLRHLHVLQLLADLAHARDELHDALKGAQLLDAAHLRAKIFEIELGLLELLSRASASLASMVDWAFSMSVRTSPMPRIREAMRSGWKTSISLSVRPCRQT